MGGEYNGTATQKARLSDGRAIRPLSLIVKQAGMFTLHTSGLYVPKDEGIMTVRDLDDALNVSDSWPSIRNERGFWRSGEVAFYRRGFETDLSLQIGVRQFWIESELDDSLNKTGNVIAVSFNGPEEAARLVGMGVIPLSKLSLRLIDEINLSAESLGIVLGSRPPKGKEGRLFFYELALADDFDSATDLKVKDVARPRSWSTSVDEDGYALNDGRVSNVVGWNNMKARRSYVRHSDEFEVGLLNLPELVSRGINPEVLSYIGSLARNVDVFGIYVGWRYVLAVVDWSDGSGVAVVERVASAQLDAAVRVIQSPAQ